MNTVIETLAKESMKENIASFNVGDTVKVHIKFKEITRGGTDANKSKNARTDKSVLRRHDDEPVVVFFDR